MRHHGSHAGLFGIKTDRLDHVGIVSSQVSQPDAGFTFFAKRLHLRFLHRGMTTGASSVFFGRSLDLYPWWFSSFDAYHESNYRIWKANLSNAPRLDLFDALRSFPLETNCPPSRSPVAHPRYKRYLLQEFHPIREVGRWVEGWVARRTPQTLLRSTPANTLF